MQDIRLPFEEEIFSNGNFAPAEPVGKRQFHQRRKAVRTFPARCRGLAPQAARLRWACGKVVSVADLTGWGSWIRTRTDGVRVRCSTVKLIPNRKGFATGVPMAHGNPANRSRKRKPGGAITAQRRYLQAHPVAFGRCFRAVAPSSATASRQGRPGKRPAGGLAGGLAGELAGGGGSQIRIGYLRIGI